MRDCGERSFVLDARTVRARACTTKIGRDDAVALAPAAFTT
jgi:hypothetical protein